MTGCLVFIFGNARRVATEEVLNLDADVQREVQMKASIFDDIVQVDLVSWHGYKVSDVQARLYTFKYVCSI